MKLGNPQCSFVQLADRPLSIFKLLCATMAMAVPIDSNDPGLITAWRHKSDLPAIFAIIVVLITSMVTGRVVYGFST